MAILGTGLFLCIVFAREECARSGRLATHRHLSDGRPVMLSAAILEPSVVGVFHPVLLLPEGIDALDAFAAWLYC
jgi:hypothetical protein